MKCTLFNIGKTDENYLEEGIQEYTKRVNHYLRFAVENIQRPKLPAKTPVELVKAKEGEVLVKRLKDVDFIILLDEKGKEMTSREFSYCLQKIMDRGLKHVAFVTGGAFGFSGDVYSISNQKISLSKMTYTHQIVRLVFVEQLYRALTILKGQSYHND